MQTEGARPKGKRAPGDEPTSQPMHATRQGEIRKNPSTDQKKTRRLQTKTATVLNTDAWRLNPGDNITMPNGRTQQVHRVRPHETSAHHVYVDTDGGTTMVERASKFQVRQHNSQQQAMPGYGVPGANSNRLPFDPQANHATDPEGGGAGANNTAPSKGQTECPNCHAKGTLARQGDHYKCSRCGFVESFGGAGSPGAFSDSPRQVRTPQVKVVRRESKYTTINTSGMSAIARRAQTVLAQEENS